MSEEIKEILDNIEVNELKHNKWYCSVEKGNMEKILDYITNLQQLCDKYEEEHNTTFKKWQKDIQANKKAIEYIKENQDMVEWIHIPGWELLEILEGNNEYNK